MTLRLLPPKPTLQQLKDKAASGCKGCVAARKALSDALHEQLAAEVARMKTETRRAA